MATTNIPQNESYQSSGRLASLPQGIRYTPSTTYQHLAALKRSGASPFAPSPVPVPGTPEEDAQRSASILKYGRLVNEGMGIPTGTQFLPPVSEPRTPIPIPPEYGTFAEPMSFDVGGNRLSWGTPASPVIRNISGDVSGQYVQDVSDPNLLVKTTRGNNPIVDRAIRDGRPGFMYQIDHIMPLSLGGADTLANRELLTSDQNDKKTRAQAIPYTLYAHGDITLSEARALAMQWKDRDLTDVPQPNNIGFVSDTDGKTGIEIAREVAQRWTQPKKPTLKDVIGGIPEAAKDLGEGWLPDSVREFVKGFGSGATLGFIPYEQDDNESAGAWWTGKIGQVAGGVASFFLGSALLNGALRGAGLAFGALNAYRGTAAAQLAKVGFKAAQAAETAVAAKTTFSTLNKMPGYLSKVLTPQNIRTAAKFGAANVAVGQAQQFIANKFNPYTLSDRAFVQDQEHMMWNIGRDLAVGSLAGIGSPTIKGTAYATMLPLTLTYLENPDNPLDAITNGVIFGAMHGVISMRNPGFNDVKMFGGKPYENPVLKSFEDTVDRAAYSSLGFYAPDIYPELKSGQFVPKAAHLPETVQAARDTAIENVWKRFFFGKTVSIEVKEKTLGSFKEFASDVEAVAGGKDIAPLSGWKRFSMPARREHAAQVKRQTQDIKDTFGKSFSEQKGLMKGGASLFPDEGMDLHTALTEIKRITVAARQLYKGGLTKELRNAADVDDLLSFGKGQLQNRFDAMEKFTNPPVAQQAVDLIDDSFMQRSFSNSRGAPSSGKYPVGDLALTGAALKLNEAQGKYFFEQKDKGNASPNIFLVDRADTAPLWRMKNQLLDESDIKAGNYAADLNPENALQAFGVVKNPQSGQRELVPLGWVASDFRLNIATGKDHRAFNQHPAVKRYTESGGVEGIPPLSLNKDQIASTMRKEDVGVLVANLDPRATIATKETGNIFIPVNINDQNWIYSKSLGDRLMQQENTTPISMAITKVNSALGAKQKAVAIANMRQRATRPASVYIPVSSPKADTRVVMPQETTRQLIRGVEQTLDVASPVQVKEGFKNNFGILLDDSQASEIFAKRNELTVREGVKLLVDAVNTGNINAATKVKLQFAKTYLESGALQSSEGGRVVPDMPILGKEKRPIRTGQEEHMAVPATRSRIPSPVVALKTQPEVSTTRTTAASGGQTNSDGSFWVTQTVVKPGAKWSPLISAGHKVEHLMLPKERGGGWGRRIRVDGKEMSYDEATPLLQEIIKNSPTQLELTPTEASPQIIPNNTRITPPQIASVSQQPRPLVDRIVERASVEKMVPIPVRKAGEGVSSKEATVREVAEAERAVDVSPVTKEMLQPVQKGKTEAQKEATRVAMGLEKYSDLYDPMQSGMKPWDPSIPKSTFDAPQFYKNIDTGLANKDNPGAYYFAKTLDTGLKAILGPAYRTNKTAEKSLGDFFTNHFFRESNLAGREREQLGNIMEMRARGDWPAEKALYEQRRIQELQGGRGISSQEMQRLLEKYGEVRRIPESELPEKLPTPRFTKKDLEELGLEDASSEGGAFGMSVSPEYEMVGKVRDLTLGEDLMGAIFVDSIPERGAQSVRAVRKLFLDKQEGLAQHLMDTVPEAKRRSIQFDSLEKEAKAIDAQHGTRVQQKEKSLLEAEKTLPELKKQLESIQKAMGDPLERPNWQTPEMLEESVKSITEKMRRFSDLLDEGGTIKKHDGAGGPGLLAGAWGTVKRSLDSKPIEWQAPKQETPPETPNTYSVRGVKITDEDINEIIPILFAEVSNRSPERQQFEARHIISTGLNRIVNNPKYRGLGGTLAEVFKKPGQYGGYAPHGKYDDSGKITESEYQKAKRGNLDAPSQAKMNIVTEIANLLKSGQFEDVAGGKMFYAHASDGALWLGATTTEATSLATAHEIKYNLPRTKFNTRAGLPAGLGLER